MWSRRAQEYEAKISSGKIYDLAEVVRDLNKGDDIMVDQSYSERQLFEKAYDRILSEFQIVLDLSIEDTAKKLNKALKRNLEGQSQVVKSKTTETPSEKIIDAKNASRIFFVKFNILPPSNYILKSTKPENSMINIKNLYIYLKKKCFL